DVGADMTTLNALADRALRGKISAAPTCLDLDADDEVKPFTDGVVLLRWLSGLRGDLLVAGAVGEGCGLCTPAQIEPEMLPLDAVLDVDGDGHADARTGGGLVLRHL